MSTATTTPASVIAVTRTSRRSGKIPGVAEGGVVDEERQGGGQKADEQQFAREPGLVRIPLGSLHFPLVGTTFPADKRDMSHRVLIVDDHPLTRDALGTLLAGSGFRVVGEAENGEDAVRVAQETQPDVVLLDLSMPGTDGLTALPAVRAAAPSAAVVVLTASGTDDNLLAAIRGGAAGYLMKSEPPDRIVDFLRASRAARPRSRAPSQRGSSSRSATATAAATAGCPTRSHGSSARAKWRCCSFSTSTSGRRTSRSASSSPSIRSAHT